MSQPAEALAALSEAFAEAKLRWYLFGAQAVVLYGRPRLTTDIDVTVEIGIDQASSLAYRLRGFGFLPQTPDIAGTVARTRVLPLVHEASGVPVDLVIAGPGLEAQFLQNVRTLDVGGIQIPVIDPADLLAAKLLAGRPRDLEDVQGILEQQTEGLDLARTRQTLRLLEQALDRSDLISELDRIIERQRS